MLRERSLSLFESRRLISLTPVDYLFEDTSCGCQGWRVIVSRLGMHGSATAWWMIATRDKSRHELFRLLFRSHVFSHLCVRRERDENESKESICSRSSLILTLLCRDNGCTSRKYHNLTSPGKVGHSTAGASLMLHIASTDGHRQTKHDSLSETRHIN